MAKKALLMILDGWGCGDHKKDDVLPPRIGTVCWLHIRILSFRQAVKTWVCPMVRWVTRK